MSTLKEKIENHLGLYTAGIAISSFLVGFGAYPVVVPRNNLNAVDTTKECDWKTIAKKEGWLLKSECPSYPIEIKISSPGDQSVITFS